MCGVAGIKYKHGPGPLGRDILEILLGINHRGPDSSGMALYGEPLPSGRVQLRARLDSPADSPEQEAGAEALAEAIRTTGATVLGCTISGDACLVEMESCPSLKDLANRLRDLPGVELQSGGAILEIMKAVGPADELDRQFGVRERMGTHGVGHVRLATESQILVSTSHPFWAFGFPDVAVVHNGQLTNYYRLRRWLESRGWKFATQNDTELIAIYVADKLDQGYSLRETLEQSLKDFDGTFSCIVSTADEIGFAKDMLGAKPLVVAETEDMILLASEEVGIQRVVHDPNLITVEPYPLEVQTW
ncbi:MAG: amidophosphoribosyltransferase [Deltaproteobacteria bacterium]|nr:amidophosphoribosyltransferase [Deltaproteobacteria bacterium]